MIEQDDWDRVARFAAGECGADEAAALARWIEADAERREALAFVRDVHGAAQAGRPQWDTDGSWERLVARRSARVHEGRVRPPLRLTPNALSNFDRRRWYWRWAAAAVAAGSLAGLWHFRLSAAREVAGAAHTTGQMPERETRRGERITFYLPDGSLVILAPASRVHYPRSFDAAHGPRDVYLEGEALFDVRHDDRRPFLVHTARGVTEDLGTRFTVREYPGDTAVQVVVAAGRVELRTPGRPDAGVLLHPGQLGRLVRNDSAIVRSEVDVGRYLAWTHGQLVFEDTPLRDALRDLGRWYDLDFVLADSALGARTLTTTLAGEAISETLPLLASALGVGYSYRGRTVTFVPLGRGRAVGASGA